jgi:hypothetical protein
VALAVAFAGTGAATTAARSDHDHDATYAAFGHHHDAAYAALGHDHDAAYAALGHDHDAAYVNEGQANSITSGMIVDGTVGSADINAGEVQRRVTGVCNRGRRFAGINADGTMNCVLEGSSWHQTQGLYLSGSNIVGAPNIYFRINPPGQHFGRLEASLDAVTWGTVCDDFQSGNSMPWVADFLCRRMGFSSGRPLFWDAVPDGTGSIFLDDFQCPEGATEISQCTALPWGSHNCSHSEDVGVYCIP